MISLIDCSRCACLIEATESSCPFCGASVRGATTWSPWLGLAFAVTLGAATAACGEKGDGPEDTDATTMNSSSSDTRTSHSGDSTVSDSFPDGVTYAGPDESWTTTGSDSDSTTTTSTSTSTSTSTTSTSTLDPTLDSWPDASTYAGPDETTLIDSSSTSSTSSTGDTGDTGDTSGDTSDTTG